MLEHFKKYKSTKKNIKLKETGSGFVVTYYNTDIAEFDGENLKLRNGGWNTPSTKNHLNAILSDFDLSIYQFKYEWFLSGKCFPHSIPFHNGMVVPRLEALL